MSQVLDIPTLRISNFSKGAHPRTPRRAFCFLHNKSLIHPNPGPTTEATTNINYSCQNRKPQLNINCLYMNAWSIVNKVNELQVLATNMDLLAITETWLTPVINSCKILPNMNFTIHRRDRFEHNNKGGGGVLLAVRNTVPCVRKPDLKTSAEIVVCELHPSCKKKILMAVFYRPPSSDYLYLKEFMKFLDQASRAKCDQLLIVGDFNLPDVDWATVTASINYQVYTLFTKAIKDHFLWQVIDFPTRYWIFLAPSNQKPTTY